MIDAGRAIATLSMVLAIAGSSAAIAADAEAGSADPALEVRVQRVASELRCLVCQNQTIADSNAPLAQDLRREVREMLVRGSSEPEVREFMVTRYGDFILYRPPVKSSTLALWVGPFVLLVGAVWLLRRLLKARDRSVVDRPLSPADEARLATLVANRQGSERG